MKGSMCSYNNIQNEEGKLRHYYMKYCKEVTTLEFSLVWLLWLILSRDSEGTKRVPMWCATVLSGEMLPWPQSVNCPTKLHRRVKRGTVKPRFKTISNHWRSRWDGVETMKSVSEFLAYFVTFLYLYSFLLHWLTLDLVLPWPRSSEWMRQAVNVSSARTRCFLRRTTKAARPAVRHSNAIRQLISFRSSLSSHFFFMCTSQIDVKRLTEELPVVLYRSLSEEIIDIGCLAVGGYGYCQGDLEQIQWGCGEKTVSYYLLISLMSGFFI